jgi:hypothetical protein
MLLPRDAVVGSAEFGILIGLRNWRGKGLAKLAAG